MHALGVGLGRSKTLYVSRERIPVRHLPGGLQVLWVRSYDQERPEQVLADYLRVTSEDITEAMLHTHLRERNRNAWQERGFVARFDPERHMVIERVRLVDDPVSSVEIGLSAVGRTSAECVLAPEGKTMRVVPLDGVAPTIARWIWRGNLTPGELFDDVERDECAWRFVLQSIEVLPGVIRQWAGQLEEPLSTSARRSLFGFLLQWAEGSEGEAMCRALGFWSQSYASRYEVWRAEQSDEWFGLSAYRNRVHRTDSELMRLHRALGVLGRIRLCEDVSGKPVGVGELLKSALEDGTLAVVSPEGQDAARRNLRYIGPMERVVLALDEDVGRLMRALCGADRLLVFDGELARMAGEKRFLSLRKQEPVLGRSVDARVDMAQPGCRGQVGFFARHRDVPGRCEVRLLYLGRCVAEVMIAAPYGRLMAVVDAESLQPRFDWRGVVEDERYEQVMELVRQGIQEVYHEHMAEMMAQHGTVDRDAEWFCMMCRMAGLVARGEVGERLSRMLRTQPVWRMASGERMALAAVWERLSKVADLVYATSAMVRSDFDFEGQGVDKQYVLVVPSRVAQVDAWLLECISGHHRVMSVEDVQGAGERLELARRRFEERELEDVELSGSHYVVTRRFAGPGYQGKIGLRVDEAPLLCRGQVDVMWMSEQRRVMRRQVNTGLGCFDAVWDEEALIDWSSGDEVCWDVVRRAERVLGEKAEELWALYAERARGVLPPDEAHMVMMYVWQCRERSESQQILEVLQGLPVFEDAVGTAWSVAQLRELEEVECVVCGGEGFEAMTGVLVLGDEAQRRALEGAIFPTRVVDVQLDGRKDRPLQGVARTVQQVREEQGVVWPLELEALGGVIAGVIEEVCGEALYLRDPQKTRAIEVAPLEAGGATALAREDGIWLSREANAVEVWSGGVVELAVLVSAVYSALNVYEGVVTDRHEEEFLSRLARWSVEQRVEIR